MELPPGTLEVSLARPNLADPEAFRVALRAVLERVGALSGGDVSVVLPDPVVRLALVPAEGLRGRRRDAEETIRFRLHKALPFDVRAARLAWSAARGEQALVAVALEEVVRGYEDALESLGFRPGLVEPASLALVAAAEAGPSGGDRLLVNWDDGYVSFVLTRAGQPLLLRTLPGDGGRDDVARHATSTRQFHQDRLGGEALADVVVRSAAVPGDEAVALLGRALDAAPRLLAAVGRPRGHGAGPLGPGGRGRGGVRPAEGGVSAPLNLARRPFRNERLPTLVLAAACLALAVATVRHALVARDLAPGRARDVASEVVAMEKEIGTLRARVGRAAPARRAPRGAQGVGGGEGARGPPDVLVDGPLRRARGGAAAGGEARLRLSGGGRGADGAGARGGGPQQRGRAGPDGVAAVAPGVREGLPEGLDRGPGGLRHRVHREVRAEAAAEPSQAAGRLPGAGPLRKAGRLPGASE